VVLVLRPWGLLGRPTAQARGAGAIEPPLLPPSRAFALALSIVAAMLALAPLASDGYLLVLLTDILVFALFAASLHFMMGPGGMASFGHAAYFGLGAYGAGLLLLRFGLPMEIALAAAPLFALAGALVFGWFCVRLSGVYLAMLTLAFAQIAWSVALQWDAVTGGSNGLIGVWPSQRLGSKTAYYYVVLLLCAGSVALIWRMIYSPFGYAVRASRDSPLRAEAIGIDVRRVQWAAFTVAGLFAGVAGALYAFSKGSISPETLSVPRSVDGLVMVFLGGVQTLTGPVWGAALFTWLEDAVSRSFAYWRAAVGAVILLLVLAFPQGVAGFLKERFAR
jgi:branched-chain amino acid transport system permease protein